MKKHWNHRVIAFQQDDEMIFEIHEVHYDQESNPETYNESATGVRGNRYSDLQWVLAEMQSCLTKPVLDGDNWPYEYKGNFVKGTLNEV